ncbi:hypothetical protein HAX54_036809 [Datura stramonium]|uniref:Uncharacterized protein n=1 Tax=Datura stramonium TaxID=4076 RepID=A0ABS8RN08_DATST|nr:hypothetical protein [Datura stramonium]
MFSVGSTETELRPKLRNTPFGVQASVVFSDQDVSVTSNIMNEHQDNLGCLMI